MGAACNKVLRACNERCCVTFFVNTSLHDQRLCGRSCLLVWGGFMRRFRSYEVSRLGLAVASVVLLGGQAFGQAATMPDAQIEANVLKSLAGAPQVANENIITNTLSGVV